MKKKGLIIASLLVLVMSVFFMGCPPPPEEEDDPVASAVSGLKSMGWTGSSIPTPSGTTFAQSKQGKNGNNDYLAMEFTGGTPQSFAAYKETFPLQPLYPVKQAREIQYDTESAATGMNGGLYFSLVFVTRGGTDESSDLEVAENSIFLTAIKFNEE